MGCVVVAQGERAVWASTCFVDGASWRGMASTSMMVPKDCNRSGRRRAAHLPAHQRARGMDNPLRSWDTSGAITARRKPARKPWAAHGKQSLVNLIYDRRVLTASRTLRAQILPADEAALVPLT